MKREPSRMRRLLDSLVFRLVAFGVAILALGTAGRMAFVTATLKDSVQVVVTDHLVAMGRYVAGDIDAKVMVRRRLLEAMAIELASPEIRSAAQRNRLLAEHHALVPLFESGLVVVPLEGPGVWASWPNKGVPLAATPGWSAWLAPVREGAKFVVAAPDAQGLFGSRSPTPQVVMAVPVPDAQGRVQAVLAGATAVDTPSFLSQIQSQPIGKTGGFLLVDPRAGVFVASSEPFMRLQSVPAKGINVLHDRAMAGWRGSGVTVNAFGVEELVAVTDVPAAGWFLVARMPTAEAFEPIHHIRAYIVRNAGLLTLVVVFALAVMLTWIFRPLKQAASRMREMADGEVPLSPLPVVRHDEVGEMVEAFNHLQARLRESESRLSHLAHHDPLTGLPNRRALLDRMQQAMALAQRQTTQLALLFVDIDGFKPVNDHFGHEVGDLLLQELAQRLVQNVRQADVVARLGGDEFVVLLTDVTGRESVAGVATKLVGVLGMPCEIRGTTIQVGASIGCALYPGTIADLDDWLSQADRAMYQAKREGRQTVRFND